jgi:hypothetical protein
MTAQILYLKKLNAAYMAALEYDRCPNSEEAQDVYYMFQPGIDMEELESALDDNSGRRPDEIAMSISDLILHLQ